MKQSDAPAWSLTDLGAVPGTAEFSTALTELSNRWGELLTDVRGLPELAPASTEAWREFLERYQRAWAEQWELEELTGCYASADAENKTYADAEARVSAMAEAKRLVRSALEFRCREPDGEGFAQAAGVLGEFQFVLEEARRDAELRLPPQEENLYQQLSTSALHGWSSLYDQVSGELRAEVMEDGEVVRRSIGQVDFDSPSAEVRRNNYLAAQKAWGRIAPLCARSLNHLAGTRLAVGGRVGIDYLAVPLRKNRLQRSTLEAMWRASDRAADLLTEFLRRRRELAGAEALCWSDLSAPFPGPQPMQSVGWDEAEQILDESFRPFSQDLADYSQTAFRGRWVEAENRSGKRQGGFCTSFPMKKESRIFMTWRSTTDSLSTLAHELGHGWHSWLLKDRPPLLQDYPMNLAETASTFAEMVVLRNRLQHAEKPGERTVILDQFLMDAVSFCMNIRARFLFECAFHERRMQGPLSVAEFSELMKDAQRTAYRGLLAEDRLNDLFWASKLHFYISEIPFYNFPYTFGYLLSLSIFAMADEGMDDFEKRWKEFLVLTGSVETEEVIRRSFGSSADSDQLWDRAVRVIESRLREFMDLTAPAE